jgi:type VI secretion system secreted protein Hcp
MKNSGNRKYWIAAVVLAALLLAATPSAAAKAGKNTIGYLTIAGVTDGCSDVAGYENSCLVYGFEQGVTQTGSSSGGGGGAGRAELSLIVTKPVDRASVKILEKAVTGTQIHDATIRLAPYSLTLSGVTLTKVRQYYDPLDPNQAGLGQVEDLTFGFERITWAWEPGPTFCFSVIQNRPCMGTESLF